MLLQVTLKLDQIDVRFEFIIHKFLSKENFIFFPSFKLKKRKIINKIIFEIFGDYKLLNFYFLIDPET